MTRAHTKLLGCLVIGSRGLHLNRVVAIAQLSEPKAPDVLQRIDPLDNFLSPRYVYEGDTLHVCSFICMYEGGQRGSGTPGDSQNKILLRTGGAESDDKQPPKIFCYLKA